MNVPPTVFSSQHEIVVHAKVQIPPNFAEDTRAGHYAVPPMTPVFLSKPEDISKEDAETFHNNRRKRGRYSFEDDQVPGVFAFHHKHGNYDRKNFVGVSGEGLPNGDAAQKHGGGATHFSIATRGLVTMMVNYDDLRGLHVLENVKVIKSERTFNGFDPLVGCFSLGRADGAHDAIGILMSKPSKRHPSNQCQILLV